ncbi:hypothetical protein DMENIID0001_048650 [Sergentomyia squamirostris]
MQQWKNRVAVVTGASAGIGAAITKDLVKAGMITIGLARRVERVEKLRKDFPEGLGKNLHAIKCDITKEDEILQVFTEIDAKFGGIDVLINNAGTYKSFYLTHDNNSDAMREVINMNVLAAVFCTREAFKSMSKHGRNSHVVHINSIAAHSIPIFNSRYSSNVSSASKHALKVITEVHRQEFIQSKLHIKVSSVSPGFVHTELTKRECGEKRVLKTPHLQPEDVSQSVLHVLESPPHVEIHELIIKPFGEVFPLEFNRKFIGEEPYSKL